MGLFSKKVNGYVIKQGADLFSNRSENLIGTPKKNRSEHVSFAKSSPSQTLLTCSLTWLAVNDVAGLELTKS